MRVAVLMKETLSVPSLAGHFGKSEGTVYALVQRMAESGSTERASCSGRPTRKNTVREDSMIRREVRKNPDTTANDIKESLGSPVYCEIHVDP